MHDPHYIAAVRAASADPMAADVHRGLGTEDDPAFPGMHEASARIAQGTNLDLCRQVLTGETDHGVNFCGGMPYLMRTHASGFCIYNDIAVGIKWLLDNGAQRVAYVDIDVHHGDGVEEDLLERPAGADHLGAPRTASTSSQEPGGPRTSAARRPAGVP